MSAGVVTFYWSDWEETGNDSGKDIVLSYSGRILHDVSGSG